MTSTWPVDARFINERGVLFGGFLAALSDHAMGMVTMSVLETGETFATSDLRVSFFKPVTEGTLAIEARMVHRSHNMVHTEVVLARERRTADRKGERHAGNPSLVTNTAVRYSHACRYTSAMKLMAVMLGRNTYAAALVVTKLERPVTSIGGRPSA